MKTSYPHLYAIGDLDFGDSGYVARYRVIGEMVTILAVRHQRERA